MEFRRKKQRGVNKKFRRVWYATGGYRITWRRQAFGIMLPARFQACVKVLVPGNFENGYMEMWDFVNPAKHLYKTMKAAEADCEKHQALWEKAIECTGVRAFYELFNGHDPRGCPRWARSKLNGRLVRLLMETTPRRRSEDDEDELTPDVPEVTPPVKEPEELKKTRKTKRPRKSKENPEPEKPKSEKPKRKPRSDKGKSRGQCKSKEPENE